MTQDTDYSI